MQQISASASASPLSGSSEDYGPPSRVRLLPLLIRSRSDGLIPQVLTGVLLREDKQRDDDAAPLVPLPRANASAAAHALRRRPPRTVSFSTPPRATKCTLNFPTHIHTCFSDTCGSYEVDGVYREGEEGAGAMALLVPLLQDLRDSAHFLPFTLAAHTSTHTRIRTFVCVCVLVGWLSRRAGVSSHALLVDAGGEAAEWLLGPSLARGAEYDLSPARAACAHLRIRMPSARRGSTRGALHAVVERLLEESGGSLALAAFETCAPSLTSSSSLVLWLPRRRRRLRPVAPFLSSCVMRGTDRDGVFDLFSRHQLELKVRPCKPPALFGAAHDLPTG